MSGLTRVLLCALVAIAAVFALTASPATASTSYFVEDFGSAEEPEFSNLKSLAVDQATGDVLALNGRAIRRYHADGTPDNYSALGENRIDGEGLGDETPEGGLEPEEWTEVQIAVDNSGGPTEGNIYITQGERHLVYAFSSSGAYLGKLTEYKEGAGASGSAAALGRVCGVAVDPSGAVYVADRTNEQIHEYVPSGAAPANADNTSNLSTAGLPRSRLCKLAAGAGPSAGYVFAISFGGGELYKLDAATGNLQYVVDHFGATNLTVDPATGELYMTELTSEGTGPDGETTDGGFARFDVSGASGPVLIYDVAGLTAYQSTAIAVHGEHVYVGELEYEKIRVFGPPKKIADLQILPATEVSATRAVLNAKVRPDGVALTECEFEYGTVESGEFASTVPCRESVPADSEEHAVTAVQTGLSPATEYQYRLRVKNTDEKTSTSEPETFRTLPRVFTGGPSDVSAESATANGLVRPEAEEVTECEFEYGRDAFYGASVPCIPVAEVIPATYATQAVSASLPGLEEFTVYHYRLTFTTAAGTFTGRDESFRTRGPSGLPDNRGYEQVSPPEKNGADISPGLARASLDGNRLIFRSPGGFAGAPTAVAGGLPYLASRGPSGWKTESVALPGGGFAGHTGYVALTPNLTKGVIMWLEEGQVGTFDPNAHPGSNLYLHDFSEPGAFTLLNGTRADVGGFYGSMGFVVWGSSDLSHLAIVSYKPLTAEAEAIGCDRSADSSSPPCAYEWDNGMLRLASVVDGEPVPGTPGTEPGEGGCGYEHAMSGDGRRLFFTAPPRRGEGGQLYAREDGTTTTPISESERTPPGGLSGKGAFFQNAEAAHGDRVLFTTKNSLVNADTDETNDLYLYDYTKPAGERLTLVSQDHNPNAPQGAAVGGGEFEGEEPCGGVLGASEDLRRVYFVAKNQIVPGEPETEGPKLYLWDDTGSEPTTTYIGTLQASDDIDDRGTWQGALTSSGPGEGREARLTATGRYLAFVSTAKLTGFDNEGQREVYRYDAATNTTECASCSEDASPASGAVSFEEGTAGVGAGFGFGAPVYNRLSTNVTESGQVFFETTRGLVPADSNGKMDVYEYENGRARLISNGEGADNSYLLDATPSGSDVFFTTKDRLVGWDEDENVDAYDARVNGGFPEPSLVPAACQGDACQPAPNAPNDATPASSSFEGAGNVSEPGQSRCAKGKVRRHGRCVARKRRHRHRRHARHNRPATRSNG